jgi:hypothetical protein
MIVCQSICTSLARQQDQKARLICANEHAVQLLLSNGVQIRAAGWQVVNMIERGD